MDTTGVIVHVTIVGVIILIRLWTLEDKLDRIIKRLEDEE